MGSGKIKFEPQEIIKHAISAYDNYCDGSRGNSNHNSYLLGLVLGVASVPINLSHKGSQILDEINAFDRAEIEETYIGQINMIIVSSFCGPQGLIWGYDLAVPNNLKTHHRLVSPTVEQFDRMIPVYTAQPLLEATKELFGTVTEKRFPLLPGAHVPCAGQNKKETGPKRLYCALGIGIPKDRAEAACLLMEDLGFLPESLSGLTLDSYRKLVLDKVVKSVIEVGYNQQVEYREVFVEMKDILVQEKEMGCVLVAAPYFKLAKKAVPNGQPGQVTNLSLEKWKGYVKKDFLSNATA